MSPPSIEPVSFHRPPHDFAANLGASFKRHGFAVVEGHGIDETVSDAVLTDAKAVFALPEMAKRAYHVPGGAGQRGYTPFAVETAKGAAHADLKEFWHVGRETDGRLGPHLDNVWPAEVADLRPDALALFAAFERFGGAVLAAIGAYLKLPAGFLEDAARGGNSVLRLLRYPPADFDGPALRAGPPRRPASSSSTGTAPGCRSTRRPAPRWSISATCWRGSPTMSCPRPPTGWSTPRQNAAAWRATRCLSSCIFAAIS
jgi:hypothetical protein